MHFGITRKTIEKMRHLERGAVRLFFQRQLTAFLSVGQSLGQFVCPRIMRKTLSEAADLKVGDAQNFSHFGEGAAGLKSGKSANDSGMVPAKFFEDQINDIVFSVVR